MHRDATIAGHYGRSDLLAAIEAGLVGAGIDRSAVTVDDLGPVDEFHVGGRPATRRLLDQVTVAAGSTILDVGCGLGGTARLLASSYDARVTGIDLTADYVETARSLNRWVGLDDRIDVHVGSALELPFDDAGFDGAVMLHVGMNIEDKAALLAEVARTVRPGGWFALYDLMLVGSGVISFPVPWSSVAETSHVASPDEYRRAAEGAGFRVEAQTDRRAEAKEFFDRLRAGARSGGPPPLGLHLVMGPTTPTKVGNMVAAVEGGTLAPTELILRRAD